MSSYENKTAIITGGAEGIGLAVARSYGERGMNIVVADIDEAQMALGVKELTDLGIKAIGLPLDVVEPSQWQDVVTKTQSEFGDIHFLLNNAGVSGMPGPIEKTKHNDWRCRYTFFPARPRPGSRWPLSSAATLPRWNAVSGPAPSGR